MHDRLQRSIFAFALPLLCASCSWITKAELAERADQDGDGHEAAQFGGADCDDGDASVNPDAAEACNALDDDCDGAIDDVAMSEETIFYADLDEDGAGDPAATVVACTQPTGSVTNGLDCDDGDASLNPDAAEICDGVDNDCDGEADDSAIDGTAWYTDADEDGFGVEESRVTACEAPAGTVAQAGDCDDADAAVHPYAEEPCEDADYNCDGLNGALDDDGDGVKGCEGDCDDGDAAVSPDADEVCNTLDDDCDELIDDADPTLNTSGLTLYYPDADGDGFGDEGDEGAPFCEQPAGTVADDQDCDDADEDINPDAVEVCSTASDDDCDGGTTDCTLELIDLPLIFDGETDGERAGVSLLSGQDLDGDGRADLVVGATERYDGKGGVYVVLDVPEASSELGENVAWKGTTEGDDAGYALASGGDLDGDGYAEIAASAPGGEVAYLLSGPADAGGGLSGAEVVVSGPGGGTGFGAAMVMGDLDGDGDADLALGAPYEAVALGLGLESANVGMAYLLAGPLSGELESDDATATFQPSAEEAQSQTGRALAVADADGDGVSELVVSAYNPGVLGASPVPTVYVVDLSSGGGAQREQRRAHVHGLRRRHHRRRAPRRRRGRRWHGRPARRRRRRLPRPPGPRPPHLRPRRAGQRRRDLQRRLGVRLRRACPGRSGRGRDRRGPVGRGERRGALVRRRAVRRVERPRSHPERGRQHRRDRRGAEQRRRRRRRRPRPVHRRAGRAQRRWRGLPAPGIGVLIL